MDTPAETIATTGTPRGEVALRERTTDDGIVVHELVVAGALAADSAETAGETARAQLPLERVDAPARVLLHGLGLGFTAWQVLKDRRVRDLHVVEPVEDLVHWARLGLTPTLGVLARHPRVTLHAPEAATSGDDAPEGPWDLVLLDLDEQRDHSPEAVSALLSQVAKGGALAIWSARREPDLVSTLEALAPTEEVVLPVERGGRAREDALYVSRA